LLCGAKMNKKLMRKDYAIRRRVIGAMLVAPALSFSSSANASPHGGSVARAIDALRNPDPELHTVGTARDMARIADMLELGG